MLHKFLLDHPEKEFVTFIIKGFSHGFRIGYKNSHIKPGRKKNLKSASLFEVGVGESILKELNRGHTVGPFPSPSITPFYVSPLGGVPKSDGSIRLVLDCSSPRGSSVNDGIEKSEYSVTYAKFDDAVDIVRSLGKGSFMAKLDIKHAFRICPINPLDWGLMGSKFKGKYFIDIRLPFGLRSSPFIFNTVADAFHWILVHKGYIEHSIHYLDDFFFANSTNSLCQIDLENAEYIFDCIKVPLAMDKKEGPSQVITFLGIEIDTSVMVLRLPQDKLRKAKDLISEWVDKSSCSKQDLLSLIGFLSFACKVVKPGRMFLRRLIDLFSQAKELFHFIHINKEAKKDKLVA